MARDTLEGLAERYLGDRYRSEEIRAANRDRLIDGQPLPIGTELNIP